MRRWTQRMSHRKFWRIELANQRNSIRVATTLGIITLQYVIDVLRAAQIAGAPIKEIKHAQPLSPADIRGWDVVVIDEEGGWHPFEVLEATRSLCGAREMLRRNATRGRLRPPIIASCLNDSPQEVLDEIGEEMSFLRGFKLEKGDARDL